MMLEAPAPEHGLERPHGALARALYGEPTGRQVHIWGISQLYFSSGGEIVQEWTLFNEFDVLAQLLREDPLTLEPDRA